MTKAESRRVRQKTIPLANPRRDAPPVARGGRFPPWLPLGAVGTREALADGLTENVLDGVAEGRIPPTPGVLDGLEDEEGAGMMIAVVVG